MVLFYRFGKCFDIFLNREIFYLDVYVFLKVTQNLEIITIIQNQRRLTHRDTPKSVDLIFEACIFFILILPNLHLNFQMRVSFWLWHYLFVLGVHFFVFCWLAFYLSFIPHCFSQWTPYHHLILVFGWGPLNPGCQS